MKTRPYAVVLLPLALLLFACPPAEQVEEPDTTEADLAALSAVADNYVAANNAGDVDTLMGLYTAEGSRMPPGAASLSGEELRANLALFAAPVVLTAETVDVGVDGSLGYGTGTYTLTVSPEEGEPVTEEGKWMFVAARQDDGSWKMVHNMWNTNTPDPPMGSEM